LSIPGSIVPSSDYCREVESYLCRKNDGHLIRVVGPSFDLVSRWAAQGVPLKVVFLGVDRHFERYYRKGPRRRPVRIDFCEADVLDAFDEWRRAVGLPAGASDADGEAGKDGTDVAARRGASLPAHLGRVVLRLSSARATGRFDASADALIDRIADELEQARSASGGVRGEARRALLDRLTTLDAELGRLAIASFDAGGRAALEREADEELIGFRDRLTDDAYARAHAAVVDRLARARLGLPTVSFS
jgi:hypothetical protein